MPTRRRSLRFWLATFGIGFLVLTAVAAVVWRDDIIKTLLDPKVPFGKDHPPPAPDYSARNSWALLPDPNAAQPGQVDVFFLHPTVYNGGKHWNSPILDHAATVALNQVMLPNYAAPFDAVGDVYAPRYREASLYTKSTLWDDAIEAREFAYGDVKSAFEYYLAHFNRGRPFIIVGAEQGGELGARLLREVIAADPALRARLVAAYLIDTIVPADEYGPAAPVPACASRAETGCLVAWAAASEGDFTGAERLTSRARVWSATGLLEPLGDRAPLCVNPLLGAAVTDDAPARLNRGAAAATGLEWGVRPGFMVRQVGAQCQAGILRVTRPRSSLLQPSGGWVERVREPGYNLFWGDLEADSQARTAAWFAAHPASLPAPGRQSNSA
ncbi:MAG TPA: DUF3089 domain-containing protein [Caulobacteraceae bacterium]|jgi:hypothetical protein|nr:DUF3089 domain-containing protein [Caulobacteraceae bacterium]